MYLRARAQMESLRKADLYFGELAFMAAASNTYNRVLAAEGAVNPDRVSDAVTPAFLAHLKQRVGDWKRAGCSRVTSEVALDGSTIFKAEIGGENQSITVRFTGSGKLYTKDDGTGLVTDGSARRAPFSDFATFVRPAGSTTPGPKLPDGPRHCPACGAPVCGGALKCAYCATSLIGTGGIGLLEKISASAYL